MNDDPPKRFHFEYEDAIDPARVIMRQYQKLGFTIDDMFKRLGHPTNPLPFKVFEALIILSNTYEKERGNDTLYSYIFIYRQQVALIKFEHAHSSLDPRKTVIRLYVKR